MDSEISCAAMKKDIVAKAAIIFSVLGTENMNPGLMGRSRCETFTMPERVMREL